RGEETSPRWLLGSGFVVKAAIVITAAQNLGDGENERGPEGTRVRSLGGAVSQANVLVRSDEVDLALLSVPKVRVKAAKIGMVDTESIEVVRDVMAVGFPNYKYAKDLP